MKCKTYKCKARCCYNVPFSNGELERFADKIVNPVLDTEVLFGGAAVLPMTNPAPLKNRCPFLRADYSCNIYADRPGICHLMAEVPEMPCRFRKL